MNAPDTVPFLPDNAPFTAEQRAYLNGFLAGLFSRQPPPVPEAKRLTPLCILFGSQTGTAENLAKRAADEARKRGFAPIIHDLAAFTPAQLASERNLLVVTSTYGDGEPPDNAKVFWEKLSNGAPPLSDLRFAVLALGDSNYPQFCAFGKNIDQRLETLGGQRVHPRGDCDVDYEQPFAAWIGPALTALLNGSAGVPPALSGVSPDKPSPSSAAPTFNRKNPFPAPLIANRKLNGPGSAKDTRHIELALMESGLAYEAGDALGVRPCNCTELVRDLLQTLGFSGEETVSDGDGQHATIRDTLVHEFEITRVQPALVKAVAEKIAAPALQTLSGPDLARFLHGRDVIDLFREFPQAKFSPSEFISLLKRLAPRLYSIASSPKAHPDAVHLCVGIVRYKSEGRPRKGVCSTFLADRVTLNSTVPIFMHHNKNFRPPRDPAAPMIMVGPGTGIAPFRAFLQERRALAASGKNWLFFGDQHAQTDFLYRDEIEAMLRDGLLTHLDAAFSRDQAGKVYVQHRMLERAREVFDWLESGAHFYVCGDAFRMAKDVGRTLHEVIETGGGRTPEQAAEYVRRLAAAKRYQRDVY
ncbi:MAG: sulfite reductase subunit alpha [Verrucomicrobia subdivision 3 bacterium]|nr:sulfite reductase subunit alpha [Limisphaerales bacterium]